MTGRRETRTAPSNKEVLWVLGLLPSLTLSSMTECTCKVSQLPGVRTLSRLFERVGRSPVYRAERPYALEKRTEYLTKIALVTPFTI